MIQSQEKPGQLKNEKSFLKGRGKKESTCLMSSALV